MNRVVSLCSGKLAMLSLALLCASCALKDDDRVPTFPVKGRVLVNGEPAKHAKVFFHPQDSDLQLFPHGQADSNGYFQLSTYMLNDGAPAGAYVVTIVWQDPPPPGSAPDAPEGPDRLKGRFADPRKASIRVHIAEGTNELDPFQLKLP